MTQQYSVTRQETSVIYLDRATSQAQDLALIRTTDQITLDSDIARYGMHAMKENVVMAHHLAAEALALADKVVTEIPQTDRSQEFVEALTHDFLQNLGELTSAANNEIKARCLSSNR